VNVPRAPATEDARPTLPRLSLTLVAWAFILVGAGSILKDLLPLVGAGRSAALTGLLVEGAPMLTFIWLVRALAVVGGVGVLRGRPWARWLLAAWMIFHVGISLFHSAGETAAHVVIFSALTWALFRPTARPSSAGTASREQSSRDLRR
jgi:hypothetical protein